jgi:hypothetical protein
MTRLVRALLLAVGAGTVIVGDVHRKEQGPPAKPWPICRLRTTWPTGAPGCIGKRDLPAGSEINRRSIHSAL